jgi:hypothetical protein
MVLHTFRLEVFGKTRTKFARFKANNGAHARVERLTATKHFYSDPIFLEQVCPICKSLIYHESQEVLLTRRDAKCLARKDTFQFGTDGL